MSYQVIYKKECLKRLAVTQPLRWDFSLAERYARRAGKQARNG